MEKDALGTEQLVECEKGETENSGTYILEYESYTVRGGDAFVTLQDLSWTILTRN